LKTPVTRADFRHRYSAPTPAAFLDRDGVIVEEVNYLGRPEDVVLIPRAVEAVTALNAAGIPVVLITNQAGIGRGYYGWPEFLTVQACIERALQTAGAWLDGVWACAHHPDGIPPYSLDGDWYRKPNPGMLLDAAEQMNLNLSRSWLVGDKIIDLEAGMSAGLADVVLVRTGYGASMEHLAPLQSDRTAVHVANDLWHAVEERLRRSYNSRSSSNTKTPVVM
jgi:D-glycero-D-manno-heptose 1,7-bisphosphate phosphatase